MENIAKTGKSAELLAAEIRLIKDQTVRTVLQASIEIGERLCEAKEIVPYGEWENWLHVNVDYSQSTAQNLMKIYREYGTDQASLLSGGRSPKELFGDLSYSQALTLLSLPEEERTEFAETHEISNMSTRELKEEIEQYKHEIKEAEQQTKQLKEELLKANIDKSNAQSAEQAAELRADNAQKEADKQEKLNKVLAEAKRELSERVAGLQNQIAELTDAPAELSEEQRAEIERLAEERYKNQLAQLTLDKETAEQTARELKEEKAELIRKAQNESNAELQKIQFLFERIQTDAGELVTLANRIGGEKAEKLKSLLRQTIIQISGGGGEINDT